MWAQQHGQTQQLLIQNKQEFVSNTHATTPQQRPANYSPVLWQIPMYWAMQQCLRFRCYQGLECQVWEMQPVCTWLLLLCYSLYAVLVFKAFELNVDMSVYMYAHLLYIHEWIHDSGLSMHPSQYSWININVKWISATCNL